MAAKSTLANFCSISSMAVISARIVLKLLDFLDAPRVPAALEVGRQPDAHHAVDQLLAEQVGRQTQDVGVVVPPAHLGGDAVVTRGGADVSHPVGGDGHSHGGA